MMKEGLSPGVQYLMVLGHDVAGIIDEVGKDVVRGKPGQRVVFRESF